MVYAYDYLNILNNFNRNVTLVNNLRDIQHFYFCNKIQRQIEKQNCKKGFLYLYILMLLLGYLDGYSI